MAAFKLFHGTINPEIMRPALDDQNLSVHALCHCKKWMNSPYQTRSCQQDC